MAARLLALAILLSADAFGAFRFQIPEGFQDLSPGAPDSAFAGLPETVVAEARSGKYAAFAMDMRELDGFGENFNAILQSGALRVDEDFAREHKQSVQTEYAKMLGGPVTILEHGIPRMGGVSVLRAVYDVQTSNVAMRQLQYMVPGGNEEWAILTYTATPDTFARYLPVFEASAAATLGIQEAKLLDWGRVGMTTLYGAGIGAVIGMIAQVAKMRKKKANPVPRRMPPRPGPRPRR